MVNASPTTFRTTAYQSRSAAHPTLPYSHTRPSREVVLYEAPTLGLVYEDALLWSFLGYFAQTSASHAWNSKLPQLKSAKNAAAMNSAARAVSLAFAAQNLNDLSMAAAACESYGESLRYHQQSFVAAKGRPICFGKAINALPVTVLLSYFEMIQPTSADAWIRHTTAAERLFVRLGPKALKDDLLNHLYFIVKSNSAIRSFVTGSKAQLFGPPWSNIPMKHVCGDTAFVFNSVVDLIARLSDHFVIEPPSFSSTSPQNSVVALRSNLVELTQLWDIFATLIGLDPTPFPWIRSDLETTMYIGSSALLSEDDLPELPLLIQEPSICLSAAFLYAAAILVLVLLQRAEPDMWSHTNISASISHHAVQILSCTKYLAVYNYGHGCSCLRMMLPLSAVQRLSPDPQHGVLAQAVFKSWSSGIGLPGLSSIAFGKNASGGAAMAFVAPVQEILQEVEWSVGTVRALNFAVTES